MIARAEDLTAGRPLIRTAGGAIIGGTPWVDTTPVPRPSLAAQVNAEAVLLRRVQACRRLRDRLPNLVAVDFYRRGDVLGVVDALNGIAAPPG